MMKLEGREIWREGQKIGWVEGHKVYAAHDGKEVGYFDDKHIYNLEGKVAYVEGDHLYSIDGNVKVSLEEIGEKVEGVAEHELEKCAIYTLLGD